MKNLIIIMALVLSLAACMPPPPRNDYEFHRQMQGYQQLHGLGLEVMRLSNPPMPQFHQQRSCTGSYCLYY